MKPVVIYHANCWDGFCAAWLFWHAFPKATFIPAQHGSEPPEEALDKSRSLFIVDFSYPLNVMVQLGSLRRHNTAMTVLDHHQTAHAALSGLSYELAGSKAGSFEIVFHMQKSGARLAWEWLVDKSLLDLRRSWFQDSLGMKATLDKPTWLVSYTEDRDLWQWKLDDSRAVNACLRSHPLNFSLWTDISCMLPMQLVSEGNAILRRERQIIDEHSQHAREIEMDGHQVLCVNATVLFSDIAGELAKNRPFGACYFDRADGKRQWSLRSDKTGVDVSAIAKLHGGGGHKHAAGFQEDLQP